MKPVLMDGEEYLDLRRSAYDPATVMDRVSRTAALCEPTMDDPLGQRNTAAALKHYAEQAALAERDPLGRHQHETGAKLDAGKNRLGLVLGGFAVALQEVGRVGTYGADKYTDNGWKSVPNGVDRYTDALYRHLLQHAAGETVDADTGLTHLSHAAWNLLAALDLMTRGAKA